MEPIKVPNITRDVVNCGGAIRPAAILYDVTDPVSDFVGRRRELSELHTLLTRGASDEDGPRAVLVTGLPGIGKTELVKKYIAEYHAEFDDMIIWINAESRDTISECFRSLCVNHLKISISGRMRNSSGYIKDMVRQVYCHFINGGGASRSLFVFDNVRTDCNDVLREFLPSSYLPAFSGRSHVLLTSRDSECLVGQVSLLRLNELAPTEASAFIRGSLPLSDDDVQDVDSIHQLTFMVSGVPRALRGVTKYITRKVRAFQNTCERYTARHFLEELENNSLKYDVFNDTARSPWIKIIQHIESNQEHGALAKEILDIMAYISPNYISAEILVMVSNMEMYALGEVIELLKRYSVISQECNQACFNISATMQEVLRSEIKRHYYELSCLNSTYEQIINVLNDKAKTIIEIKSLLPHLEVFVDHFYNAIRTVDELDLKKPLSIYNILYETYIIIGDPVKAKEFAEYALKIMMKHYEIDQECKKLVKDAIVIQDTKDEEKSILCDYLELCKWLNNLSIVLWNLKDHERQCKLSDAVMTICKKHYDCHSGTSRNDKTANIAERVEDESTVPYSIYQEARLSIALAKTRQYQSHSAMLNGFLKEALEILEYLREIKHLSIITDMLTYIKKVTDNLNLQDRQDMLENILIIQKNLFGHDNKQIVGTLADLIGIANQLLDFDEQIRIVKLTLNNLEPCVTTRSEEAVIILQKSCKISSAASDSDKKLLLERVLEIKQKLFGSDHYEVALTLVDIYQTAGQPTAERNKLLKQALMILEGYKGRDDCTVCTKILDDITGIAKQVGSTEQRSELLGYVLKTKLNLFGEHNFKVSEALYDLACVSNELNDESKSCASLEYALRILTLDNFVGLPDTSGILEFLNKLQSLAINLPGTKRRDILGRISDTWKNLLGGEYYEVNVGHITEVIGYMNKISNEDIDNIYIQEQIMKIKENLFGPEHEELIRNIKQHNINYNEYELYKLSQAHVEEVANILNKISVKTSDCDNEKRKHIQEHILIIKRKLFGPDHYQVAWTLHDQAMAALSVKDKGNAREFLMSALKIMENYEGRVVPTEITEILNSTAFDICTSNSTQTKQILKRILTIKERWFGADHYEYAMTMIKIVDISGKSISTDDRKSLLDRALSILESYEAPPDIFIFFDILNSIPYSATYNLGQDGKRLIERIDRIKQKLLERQNY